MKMEFFGITFAAAQNIIFLPFLLLGILFIIWRLIRQRRASRLLASSSNTSLFFTNFSLTRQVVKAILLIIGLIFIFIALLRPQWDKKEEKFLQEGRDLFVAVDISRSMLAQDCKPNRLECAKVKIRNLVKKLKSERVGLLVFAGSTMVQSPLTSDYSAFFMFLDQLDAQTISSGTTILDEPIKKALNIFKSMPTKKNKLLVLFTDGEDFSSNLASVRKEAAKEGMNIFTVGVGTLEGAPVPLINQDGESLGHMKDKNGKIVISKLNEGILSSLAKETGGVYIRMTKDNRDMQSLVQMVGKFEKERFEDKKFSALQEQYPYFLIVSFACFALEWIL